MTKPEDHWVRNECGTDRITLAEARAAERTPIFGVLDNIRSAHNVGSIFRTADGANAAGLSICGYSPVPPHRHLSKTALGAVDSVPWQQFATVQDAIGDLRAKGVQILAMEKTEASVSLYEVDLRFPVALVMGNEAEGLSEEVMQDCDAIVHLPMQGLKNSLNVSVAFGIGLYEISRRYELTRDAPEVVD